MSEEKPNFKASKRTGLFCLAYKIVVFLLLAGIVGIFLQFLVQIRELKSTFETTAPALEKTISSKIAIGTQDVLDHIAISEKVAAPNSEIVLAKAKKYESLRLIAQAKLNLADGTFSQDELSLFGTLGEYKVTSALKELNEILMQKPARLPSDDELAVALRAKLELTTKAVFIGAMDELSKEDVSGLDKFKDRAIYYLSKLISIEPASTEVLDNGSGVLNITKYKPQDFGYYLMQNSEYGVLLEILRKHSISDSESVLHILKLKYQIKEQLIKIEELLLE